MLASLPEKTFSLLYGGKEEAFLRKVITSIYKIIDQLEHSVRCVESRVNVERVSLLHTYAANLLRDVTVSDRVELRIMGDVSAKIKILGLTSPSIQIKALVEQVFYGTNSYTDSSALSYGAAATNTILE
ncbi:hypothetical protein Tco_1073678 [Tanacetum coccineum]